MKGDRWKTDTSCTKLYVDASMENRTTTLKQLIDFDIKNRVCITPSTSLACYLNNFQGFTDVESSLILLDKSFIIASPS